MYRCMRTRVLANTYCLYNYYYSCSPYRFNRNRPTTRYRLQQYIIVGTFFDNVYAPYTRDTRRHYAPKHTRAYTIIITIITTTKYVILYTFDTRYYDIIKHIHIHNTHTKTVVINNIQRFYMDTHTC